MKNGRSDELLGCRSAERLLCDMRRSMSLRHAIPFAHADDTVRCLPFFVQQDIISYGGGDIVV